MHDTGLWDGTESLSYGSKDEEICFVQVPIRWSTYVNSEYTKWMKAQKRITDATFIASEWGIWTLEWDLEVEKQKHKKRRKRHPTTKTNKQANKQNTISHFPDLRLHFSN